MSGAAPRFKDVWQDALDAALGRVRSRAPTTRDLVRDALDAHKHALRALLSALADGKIDETTFKSALDDEQLVLEGDLRAVRAMTHQAARNAAKTFMDVIEGAASQTLSGLL